MQINIHESDPRVSQLVERVVAGEEIIIGSEAGEPVYGPRDDPDFPAFREFDRPFWLAGSRAEPRQLEAALAEGATGIQVGTAFAFCNESGLDSTWKARVLEQRRIDTSIAEACRGLAGLGAAKPPVALLLWQNIRRSPGRLKQAVLPFSPTGGNAPVRVFAVVWDEPA